MLQASPGLTSHENPQRLPEAPQALPSTLSSIVLLPRRPYDRARRDEASAADPERARVRARSRNHAVGHESARDRRHAARERQAAEEPAQLGRGQGYVRRVRG